MNIYVLCPDHNTPSGGIKKLYRHVDVLNRHGFSAAILHRKQGFRCTWFANNTGIESYGRAIKAMMHDPHSYLVFPEIYGSEIAEYAPGVKKVIFNRVATTPLSATRSTRATCKARTSIAMSSPRWSCPRTPGNTWNMCSRC